MAGSGRGPIAKLRSMLDLLAREMLKFGAVGGISFVVDTYIFNVLRTGWWPLNHSEAMLRDHSMSAKVVSTGIAMIIAWLGNRYWTFRHRRRTAVRRELVLFGTMNLGGLGIALGCLWVSHAIGQTSALADNIASNVIGLGLGTLFRFWAYRTFVFNDTEDSGVDGHLDEHTIDEITAAALTGALPDDNEARIA